MSELILAIKSYPKAFGFIKKHKLYWTILLPGLVNLFLLGVVVYFSFVYSQSIVDWLLDRNSWSESTESWWGWLATGLVFALNAVIRLALITLYFFVYKNIVMIILSPMFSYLAEVVRQKLSGEEKPFNLDILIHDTVRGVRMALRCLFREVFILALLFAFSFVPVIGIISPVLVILVQSYFYGFSMLDYCLEAKEKSFSDSIQIIKSKRMLATGVGFGFFLLSLIPFLGWMLAPALGVVSAYHALEETEVPS